MTKFTLTTVAAMLMLSSITTPQNTPTPCACPQWLWATWTDGNGNTFYSYYSQMCDGPNTGDPYWASLDTSAYYGEYPGGSCTNDGGCSDPAVPTLADAKLDKGRSVNKVQKTVRHSGGVFTGLAAHGISRNAPTGSWPGNKEPRQNPEGGSGGITMANKKLAEIIVRDPDGNPLTIRASAFRVTLNPNQHKRKNGDTLKIPNAKPITFGVGFHCKYVSRDRPDFTIAWDDVTTVSPEATGSTVKATETHCIRFTHAGLQYQVNTATTVKMK